MGARIGKDNTARVIASYRAVLRDAVYAGGLVIENAAKEKSPVLTGTLRRSINTQAELVSQDWARAKIGPNTEYAAFVEFGTRRMAAQPYMRPAYDERKKVAAAEVVRVFRSVVR